VWKILPFPDFDPQTLKPVASRYTDPMNQTKTKKNKRRKLINLIKSGNEIEGRQEGYIGG